MNTMRKPMWIFIMILFVLAGLCNLTLVLAGVATIWTIIMLTIDVGGVVFLIVLKRHGRIV